MTWNIKLLSRLIFIIGISMISLQVFGQNPVCVYCGTPLPNGIHIPPCRYATTSNSSSPASSESLNNMVAGAIFQSVLSSIFSNNPTKNKKEPDAKQKAEEIAALQAAQRAAEQQRINAAIAQAEYDKMMKSYKLLEDSQNLQIKGLNSTSLEYKTLNGDAETLATNARKQFESTSIVPPPGAPASGNGTPFFGDTMPIEDIQTLLNPENNPDIVDLRGATNYVAENIRKDSPGIVDLLRQNEPEGNGEPIIQKPDCKDLPRQLKGFTNQRQQFQKTIDLSQNEVDLWETANRNALINAAKDGLEYFTGQWLEKLTNRGKAADRL